MLERIISKSETYDAITDRTFRQLPRKMLIANLPLIDAPVTLGAVTTAIERLTPKTLLDLVDIFGLAKSSQGIELTLNAAVTTLSDVSWADSLAVGLYDETADLPVAGAMFIFPGVSANVRQLRANLPIQPYTQASHYSVFYRGSTSFDANTWQIGFMDIGVYAIV